jgi:Uma2 family endonuclease
MKTGRADCCTGRPTPEYNLDKEATIPPDLAIEVDVSRSSIDKLAICAAIGIPEVWRYAGVAWKSTSSGKSRNTRGRQPARFFPGFPATS